MTRLDYIIARNTLPHWTRRRSTLTAAAVILVVVMIALSTCTELGKPKVAPRDHVDGIELRAAPRK